MRAPAARPYRHGPLAVMPNRVHWHVPPVVRRNGNLRLRLTCGCPGQRYPPLRLVPGTLLWLREALGGSNPPADMVVQTYRCGDCGTVVEITVADMLLLAPSAPLVEAL